MFQSVGLDRVDRAAASAFGSRSGIRTCRVTLRSDDVSTKKPVRADPAEVRFGVINGPWVVGHELAGPLVEASLGMAILVSIVHVAAMIAAGGYLAWLVYRYLGLKFVSRSWFNLETSCAVSLVLVGAVALAFDLAR